MWRKSLLLILFVFPTVLFAQRECKVSGEYTYYAPLNVSPDDAIAIAVENDCRDTTTLQPGWGGVGLSQGC